MKSEYNKINRTLQNLKTANRICIMNNKDNFTIDLLETKIKQYEKLLKAVK